MLWLGVMVLALLTIGAFIRINSLNSQVKRLQELVFDDTQPGTTPFAYSKFTYEQLDKLEDEIQRLEQKTEERTDWLEGVLVDHLKNQNVHLEEKFDQ